MTISIANIPLKIPKGIPIIPNINPSKNTVFFICFLVAPILESIPYCFSLSVTEIANPFLITNTLVTNIIAITIPPAV